MLGGGRSDPFKPHIPNLKRPQENGIFDVGRYGCACFHVNRGVFGRGGPWKVLGLVGNPGGTCFLGFCGCVIVFQVEEVLKFDLKLISSFLAL